MFRKPHPKQFISILFIGLFILLSTAAFGCKKEEETTTPTASKPAESKPVPKEEEKKEEPKKEEEKEEEKKEEEKKEEKPATDESLILAQAEKIAQIYGTYSTTDDPPYQNLKNLKTYGTLKFQNYLDSIIKEKAPTGPFCGWTTKALSSAVIESSDEVMKILVTCKREEFLEAQKVPKIFYQMLELDFKKEDTDWKVDGAYWL